MTFARSVLLLSLVAAATLVADEGTTFFRNPALSATTIVFEYGGDLWTVPRSGGQAARLTTGPGEETNPVFSPDGSMVAFSGRYDGNVDVFVVPSAGGVPRRLTWHPGRRRRARLDAGRQARAVQIGAIGRARELSAAVHDRTRRRRRAAAAAAHRLRRRILARRRAHRLRARAAGVHDVEAIPRRPDDADLAGRSGDVANRARAAGQLERLPADVGRRQGLVPLRPRRSGDAVQLRPRHQEGGARGREPRDGLQVGVRRQRRHRDRTVRRSAPLRSQVRPARGAEHQRLGRSRRGARALRQGWHAPDQRLDFAERSPRGVRGARRDHHGAGGKRRRAESHEHTRRDGAQPGVVARRRQRRVFLGRVRRVRAAHRAAGRQERAAQDCPGSESTIYRAPRWSPDSKKIAFVDVHLSLWYVDLDSGKPVRVAKDRYLRTSPTWPRRGRRIRNGWPTRRASTTT